MGHRALIVVVDDSPPDERGGSTEGRSATLYEVDLDSTRGEQDVHLVLASHRRACQRSFRDTPVPHDEDDDAATIREWARQRHLPVGGRGRIATEIRRQYEEYRRSPERLTVEEAVSLAEKDRRKVVRLSPRGDHKRRRQGT